MLARTIVFIGIASLLILFVEPLWLSVGIVIFIAAARLVYLLAVGRFRVAIDRYNAGRELRNQFQAYDSALTANWIFGSGGYDGYGYQMHAHADGDGVKFSFELGGRYKAYQINWAEIQRIHSFTSQSGTTQATLTFTGGGKMKNLILPWDQAFNDQVPESIGLSK